MNEFDFINAIRQRTSRRVGGLVVGIGDDAAVVRHGRDSDSVVTADLFVEDVDFRRAYSPPRLVGHKALAVSLSDIAAMGARPRFCLLSVGVPRDVWRTKFLDEFYEGFFALAEKHKVALIGGDVSRTPERIVIDSIVIGETARGRAVRRSGARVGDAIYVTSALGGAAAGLRLLEMGARLVHYARLNWKSLTYRTMLLRQLAPEPRVAWGEFLGHNRLASAMIDISDSLSSDLAHLCRASGVGATIDAGLMPIDPRISSLKPDDLKFNAKDALQFALHGGEDYELLFTVAPSKTKRLPSKLANVGVTSIGTITDEAGIIKIKSGGRSRLLRARGFVHF